MECEGRAPRHAPGEGGAFQVIDEYIHGIRESQIMILWEALDKGRKREALKNV